MISETTTEQVVTDEQAASASAAVLADIEGCALWLYENADDLDLYYVAADLLPMPAAPVAEVEVEVEPELEDPEVWSIHEDHYGFEGDY